MAKKQKTFPVQVQNVPTVAWETLKSYEANTLKAVEDRDISKLKNAIINRGFCFPMYVWADHRLIIDGAGRCKALAELEAEGYAVPDLPVVEIWAESIEGAKALVLQASSEHGTITQESFDAFVEDIDLDALLDEINFPDLEMGEVIEELPPEEEDEPGTPDLTEDAFTVLGDLYTIGGHRLMCGDSCAITDVEKLMDGKKADIAINDPPYGVDIASRGHVGDSRKGVAKKYKPIIGDQSTDTAISGFNLCLSFEIPIIVTWGANYYAEALPASSGWIVWDKENSGDFAAFEMAWTNIQQPAKIFRHMWNGMIRASERESRVHPTQKPVALAEWILKTLDPNGQTVLDLFGGSGSTMLAAQRTGRTAFLMEIDGSYCDIILKRMINAFPDLKILKNGEPFNAPW